MLSRYFYFSSTLVFCYTISLAQKCPTSGLLVQSINCEKPKNLAINIINCTELKVKWSGNQDQAYIVKAWLSIDSTVSLKASQPSCDNTGNCAATIEVSPGEIVDWSVQAVCSDNGITTYSEPATGPQAKVPVCNNVGNNKNLQIYPNPSKGKLLVNYTGAINRNLQLAVFDMKGNPVFSKTEAAQSKMNNQYQLDLNGLAAGSYILRVLNGTETQEVKFVLMRE